MSDRLTLPQQRAQETRLRLLNAGEAVFARHGYGQATVEDIAAEAGVSIGAFYHHFSGKEQLLKAVLEEHVRSEMMQLMAIRPATSVREAVENFVSFQFEHLEAHRDADPLFLEFWALASREPWARDPVARVFRVNLQLLEGMLRVGQDTGIVRADLDVRAAAYLLAALFSGITAQRTLDPDAIDMQRLSQPWADLIERFVRGDGEGDIQGLQERLTALFEQVNREKAPSEPTTDESGR